MTDTAAEARAITEKIEKVDKTGDHQAAYKTMMEEVKSFTDKRDVSGQDKKETLTKVADNLAHDGVLPKLEIAHAHEHFKDFQNDKDELSQTAVHQRVQALEHAEKMDKSLCKVDKEECKIENFNPLDLALTRQVDKDFKKINEEATKGNCIPDAIRNQALDTELKGYLERQSAEAKEVTAIHDKQVANEANYGHKLLDNNGYLFSTLDKASNDGFLKGRVTKAGVDKFLSDWNNPDDPTKQMFGGDDNVYKSVKALRAEFDAPHNTKRDSSNLPDSIIDFNGTLTKQSLAEGMGYYNMDSVKANWSTAAAGKVADTAGVGKKEAPQPPAAPEAPAVKAPETPKVSATEGAKKKEPSEAFVGYGLAYPGEGPAQILMRLSNEFDHAPNHNVEYRGKQFARLLNKLDGHWDPRKSVYETLKDDVYFQALEAEYNKRYGNA